MNAINAESDELHLPLAKKIMLTGKRDQFRRTNGSKVRWVRKKHNPVLFLPFTKIEIRVLRGHGRKVRRRVSNARQSVFFRHAISFNSIAKQRLSSAFLVAGSPITGQEHYAMINGVIDSGQELAETALEDLDQ